MSYTGGAPAWYPDPARVHEYRYFDGRAWTDHVSDNGLVTQVPLGAAPPGLLDWHPPEVMIRASSPFPRPLAIPRGKMWTLTVLSAFVFWIHTSSRTIVLPLGIIFAIWCWVATAKILASHQSVGSPDVREIKAARGISVALALFSILQVALWTR